MRELIRPGLFWAARLALFLSVLSWIVGQGWMASITMPFWSGHVVLGFGQEGWFTGHFVAPTRFQCRLTRLNNDFNSGGYFGERLPEAVRDMITPDTTGEFLGVRQTTFLSVAGRFGTALSIRHWLVVTFVAVLYGVLKSVYRNRRTNSTCLS